MTQKSNDGVSPSDQIPSLLLATSVPGQLVEDYEYISGAGPASPFRCVGGGGNKSKNNLKGLQQKKLALLQEVFFQ